MQLSSSQIEACYFYEANHDIEANYDIIGNWLLYSNSKSKHITLGDKSKRVCRFCGRKSPEVTFKKVAHAIPELLGNNSIFSTYECDTCNYEFGSGIENDLGKWSHPMRTLGRIYGKKGIPTQKSEKSRIEEDDQFKSRLKITAPKGDKIYKIDEKEKEVIFTLERDPYTPVAVLKAFMKIGLTLLPDKEIGNFSHLIVWVREKDYSKKPDFILCPVIQTFQPGPMPNDRIAAIIMRRKQSIEGYPYCFFIFSFGNYAFQIPLPSDQDDIRINKKYFKLTSFPFPYYYPGIEHYGNPKIEYFDWMDDKKKEGEEFILRMNFDSKIPIDPNNPA